MKRDVEQCLSARNSDEILPEFPPSRREVDLNPALTSLTKSKSCLLLQGPIGPLFDRLTLWLEAQGTKVSRIVFQGGDLNDTQYLKPIRFQGEMCEWSEFLRKHLLASGTDHVVLFGQTRSHHRAAINVIKSLGVQLVVCEEGYFRPGFVTMELNGVNGFSSTMDCYQWAPAVNIAKANAAPANTTSFPGCILPSQSPHHFRKMVSSAMSHYFSMYRHRAQFPFYIHHREISLSWYASYWIRSWIKKYWNEPGDRKIQNRLISLSRPYFFVPLQCDDDSQIVVHSPFGNVAEFIGVVMNSFAKHCPGDTAIVFKLHPNSRGGFGYRKLIMKLAKDLHVNNRVEYITEGDAPILAEHSRGVVTVNSTVGMQALERGAPVIALGDAVYKRQGISFTGNLDSFWTHARIADPDLVRNFLVELKNLTQVPCCLYAGRSEPLGWSGLIKQDR